MRPGRRPLSETFFRDTGDGLMPELPEVETIARGLARSVVGRTVVRVDVPTPSSLRESPNTFVPKVLGRRIEAVRRRAKLLLIDLEGEGLPPLVLGVHLKMTGRLVTSCELPLAPRERGKFDRVIFGLDDGATLTFSDMRRFGYCEAFGPGELERSPFYSSLGPEPLELAEDAFVALFQGRRARMKALLLDQRVIAGIGNIYADESLFRAAIRPDTPADKVSEKKLRELHAAILAILRQAIAENGSSIRDYRDAGGNAGAFQNRFQVYGKKGRSCPRCGEPLVTAVVAGRTSTFCPKCQR